MTARFTHAEIARAAKVAAEAGVSVTLEAPDGRKVTVAPAPKPDADPFDFVDMSDHGRAQADRGRGLRHSRATLFGGG